MTIKLRFCIAQVSFKFLCKRSVQWSNHPSITAVLAEFLESHCWVGKRSIRLVTLLMVFCTSTKVHRPKAHQERCNFLETHPDLTWMESSVLQHFIVHSSIMMNVTRWGAKVPSEQRFKDSDVWERSGKYTDEWLQQMNGCPQSEFRTLRDCTIAYTCQYASAKK